MTMGRSLVLLLFTACQAQAVDTTCPGLTKPDVACNDRGLVCSYTGTECQHCICDGMKFVCENAATCTVGACQFFMMQGDVCAQTMTCPGAIECGTTFILGTCSCVASKWSCTSSESCGP
jgi:hypothetical protein